ncbi:MAG: hypothetical protein ABIV39_16485 [Verrucomicrobiota bacterium]
MRTFWMKYSWIVLLPAALNIWFGYLLWNSGTDLIGSIFATVFPMAGLLALYSILRPGYFFSTTYDEGHPKHVVSHKTQPGSYWSMVVLCVVWYLAITSVLGAVIYEKLRAA